MKFIVNKTGILLAAIMLATVVIALSANSSTFEALQNKSSQAKAAPAQDIIQTWPEKPKKVAQQMISKYGQPQESTPSMLIWHNNGPWKRTIVYRQEVQHNFPKPHTDVMQQYIDYKAHPEKFDELAQFDGSVIAERTNGELSARCDKEEMNFLALNLANDVNTGKKSVEEARTDYTKTVMAFMKGEKAPYVQKLQFTVAKGKTADPDKPSPLMK